MTVPLPPDGAQRRNRNWDYLEAVGDPMGRCLEHATPEDEEISAEEEAAVQGAREELAAGALLVSRDEIKRELGC